MGTTNNFKLIDEVEWIGHELQKLYNLAEDGTYAEIPALIAIIRRSLISIEKMIEEVK